jgi:hypothetical protein
MALALALAGSSRATRASSAGSVGLCTGELIGRVQLGAPLACVRSVAAALQKSECAGCLPLPAIA